MFLECERERERVRENIMDVYKDFHDYYDDDDGKHE